MTKLAVAGKILAVQPRIRLLRSFDQRHHNYMGYALLVEGEIAGTPGKSWIGVGPKAHEKYCFRSGGQFFAVVEPVENPDMDAVDWYKASKIRFEAGPPSSAATPPWLGVPPALATYRTRGHRRLSPQIYETFCDRCIWGCLMATEIILDQWNPAQRQYRRETFCYGPKSCPKYVAGPQRTVPGRNKSSWTEEDWVDEEATSERGPDD